MNKDEILFLNLDKYKQKFNESFPTFNFMNLSFEEIGQVIDHCLEEGKDVYELGYIKEDDEVKY